MCFFFSIKSVTTLEHAALCTTFQSNIEVHKEKRKIQKSNETKNKEKGTNE